MFSVVTLRATRHIATTHYLSAHSTQNSIFSNVIELRRIDVLRWVLSVPDDRLFERLAPRYGLVICEVAPDLCRIHVQVLVKIQLAGNVWRRAGFVDDHDSSRPADHSCQFPNPALDVETVRLSHVVDLAIRSLIFNDESNRF